MLMLAELSFCKTSTFSKATMSFYNGYIACRFYLTHNLQSDFYRACNILYRIVYKTEQKYFFRMANLI